MHRIDLSASIGKIPAEQRKTSANHEKSGQTVTENLRLSANGFCDYWILPRENKSYANSAIAASTSMCAG